jgi:hypothetical protein
MPLSVWKWAILFVFILGIGGFEWFFRMGPPGLSAFDKYNLDRLEEFSQRSTNAGLRIVMLGNSRLKYSTPDDAEFSRQLSLAAARKVEVLRIVNNWAVFQDFAKLLDPIAALRPDIIVLQLQLFGQQRALEARSLILLDFADWLVSGRDQLWNPGNIDQHALQSAVPCANDLSDTALQNRLDRTAEWLSFNPDGRSGRAARHWAIQQAAAGSQVVVLSIPRTPMIEQATGVDFNASTRSIVDDLVASHGVRFAEYRESLPLDAYCDVVHMNEAGQKAFSRWLVDRLLAVSPP